MDYILINIFLIIIFVYYLKKMKHGFHMLQLESYKNERYKGWINKNKNQILKKRELLLFLPLILIFINKTIALVVGILIAILIYFSRDIYKEKKPLVVTKRIKRMFITASILFIILLILSNIGLQMPIYILIISLSIINLITIFSIYMVLLINNINKPIEDSINKGFYNKAKKLFQL